MKNWTVIMLMFLSIGVYAQSDAFVNQYDSRKVYEYDMATEKYEEVLSNDLATTIFFNVKGTRNVKILFSSKVTLILYDVTANEEQPNKEFYAFTGYLENGSKITGGLGANWFSFFSGDEQMTFLRK